MNGIRRIAALTGAVLLLVMAFRGIVPAYATLSDTTGASTTITTATVAAPTNVVGTLTCGNPSSTMGLTWTASTSPGVSGYLVTVYFSDGFSQTVQTAATATSWTKSISTFNVTAYSIQYSVTTQTTYNWTQESTRTGWFHC